MGRCFSKFAMDSPWRTVSGIMGGLAVGLGAFGAHGLKSRVKDVELLESWKTAASYQMVHAIMIAVSALAKKGCSRTPRLFTAGSILFSGSIYGLVLLPKGHGLRKLLGPMTPFGGLTLIAGWISMALG